MSFYNNNNNNAYNPAQSQYIQQMPQGQQDQQQQQQQYLAPVDVFINDLYERHGANSKDELEQVSDSGMQAVPRANQDTSMVHVNRNVRFYATPRELAENPKMRIKRAIGSFSSEMLKRGNVKLVPRVINIRSVQNTLPYDIGFSFDHPDEPGRKSIKMNTNHIYHDTDGDTQDVDVLVEANVMQPMNRNLPLYSTDPKVDVDLQPYQDVADLTEEGLEQGIHKRNTDQQDPNKDYAMVYVGSPIYQIAMSNTEQTPLQEGLNMRHFPPSYDSYGDQYRICVMPGYAIDHALDKGKQIIASLPFQDPEEVTVEVRRPDGRAFDDIDDNGLMDREALLDTKHYFGMLVEEAYAPFRMNDPDAFDDEEARYDAGGGQDMF